MKKKGKTPEDVSFRIFFTSGSYLFSHKPHITGSGLDHCPSCSIPEPHTGHYLSTFLQNH